jgi:hypothetical protein
MYIKNKITMMPIKYSIHPQIFIILTLPFILLKNQIDDTINIHLDQGPVPVTAHEAGCGS